MARIREEDYAYATAHIRAIETKLINKSKLDRLLDATDASEGVKLLLESGYGIDHVNNEKVGVENVEALLSAELEKAFQLLAEILPNPEAVKLFMRRYDFLNAKLILKAELLGIDSMGSTSSMGTIKPTKLFEYITDRKFGELPEVFGKAILESLDTFNQTGDPQIIDFIMDRACYENMAQDAEKTEEPFLIELVEKLSDTANVRVFVRSKLISASGDFIKSALVRGGSISEGTLEELADKDIDQFFETIKNTWLSNIVNELATSYKRPNGISHMEKLLDDAIISFLLKSKHVILGIEPVIAYLFFKETEIKNARLIITGKVNKISQETIRERLRLGYA